jgi:hypothetical protein
MNRGFYRRSVRADKDFAGQRPPLQFAAGTAATTESTGFGWQPKRTRQRRALPREGAADTAAATADSMLCLDGFQLANVLCRKVPVFGTGDD